MQQFVQCQESGDYLCVQRHLEAVLAIESPEFTTDQDAMVRSFLRGAYFTLADSLARNPSDKDLLKIEEYCLRGIELGQQLLETEFSKRPVFQTEEITFNVKLTISYWETGRENKAKTRARRVVRLLEDFEVTNSAEGQLKQWANAVVSQLL